MSVTPDRLLELHTDLLPKWLSKRSATKTELQSLIGKLAFVSKCVWLGRLFLTRILDTLHSLRPNHHRVKLSAEFCKISAGGCGLFTFYNGESFIPTQLWSMHDNTFSTIACLTGGGSMSLDQ